ncbi:MAG: Gfo/Idh/MocA family oxidoreductase [Chloroflexi bacterium]|nr:Gfo/Idh/MocA family oxidoreductase [Chloroflexota bacterium]
MSRTDLEGAAPPAPAPLRVGVLGAGMIATIGYGYLPHLGRIRDRVDMVAIANRGLEKGRAVANAHGIAHVVRSLDELLAFDVDAVVNLLPGPDHFAASMQILRSGRHLVSEKPITSTLAEADELLDTADRMGLLVVAAPADMLAAEWRRARDVVARGAIGKVAFARVQSSHAGAAGLSWPVDPTQFYQDGVGALLDLGVYGLTQATGVLGPARRVSALSGITVRQRRARGGPFDGLAIPVSAPDNNLLLVDFGDATFAVVDATFNVVASRSPRMEVFGLEGTLLVNREDVAAPPVEVYRLDAAPGLGGWITPQAYEIFPAPADRFAELARGVLIEHLADCIRDGVPPIASGRHARHVLEIMLAAQQSARDGRVIEIATTF